MNAEPLLNRLAKVLADHRLEARWLSNQAIYDWIHQQQPEWKRPLRRGGRPAEKRGKLTDCVRIDGRPEVINGRCRFGDWKGDTMVGHGRHSALVTGDLGRT